MKVNCGPDKYAKARKKMNWHDHFAWWPVRVGPNDCRWLETVERRYDYWCHFYGYNTGKKYRSKI